MDRYDIRIAELRLRNFRNVRNGSFSMPSFLHSSPAPDILGIYGQNGSGKSAAIEALGLMQRIMTGEELPGKSYDYINIDSDSAALSLSFSIEDDNGNRICIIRYEFEIRNDMGSAAIASESLYRKDAGKREKLLISFTRGDRKLAPASAMKELKASGKDAALDLMVAMRMAEKEDISFIFGADAAFPILSEAMPEVKVLKSYADTSFIVLAADDSGLSGGILRISYQQIKDGKPVKGRILLDISKPAVISREEEEFLGNLIDEMNKVLSAIIPRLRIGIYKVGDELTAEGHRGVAVEIVSYKNDTPIPLRSESVGIIKIISLLSCLLAVYNSRSVCLVIDEFDASIFEFLLGELISVFESGAKGQLIFTSHNLRILEMVGSDSIVFSTANPDNRYIRLKVKPGNLRDEYLRSLLLGGTEEDIYEKTDPYEIGKALRNAWKQDG